MATHTRTFHHATADRHAAALSSFVTLAGRILFGAIFLMAGPMHFSPQEISYGAAQGVPWAGLLVPAAGVLAFAGALSIVLGYHARIGAWFLVAFLVPVTLTMHNFWAIHDPAMAQIQVAMFFKNVSMLGGALMITQWGSGPLSVDAMQHRRADG